VCGLDLSEQHTFTRLKYQVISAGVLLYLTLLVENTPESPFLTRCPEKQIYCKDRREAENLKIVRMFTVKSKAIVLILVGLMTSLAACQGGNDAGGGAGGTGGGSTPAETPAGTTSSPAETPAGTTSSPSSSPAGAKSSTGSKAPAGSTSSPEKSPSATKSP
jgi:hypothetical protein